MDGLSRVALFKINDAFHIVGVGHVLTGNILSGDVIAGYIVNLIIKGYTYKYTIDAVEVVDSSPKTMLKPG